MQELLGRIARLDADASLGLRVIACFDELVVGMVNTRALLAAAAALAGCVAGFTDDRSRRTTRVDPTGGMLPSAPRTDGWPTRSASAGMHVWLERDGAQGTHDAIILERLALAVRIRHGLVHGGEARRALDLAIDPASSTEVRSVAAVGLGLVPGRRYRVDAAPLFAVWTTRPEAPADVVPTRFGPIHVLIVTAEAPDPVASPLGVGTSATLEHLDRSFTAALVALRLCDPPSISRVHADEYGGLIQLLSDATEGDEDPDLAALDQVGEHGWAIATLDALIRSATVREAARRAGVHHSTMQARLDLVAGVLGWDPLDGLGRTRLGVSYLRWLLRNSTVLDLPAPVRSASVASASSQSAP
ncbi:helix-turn-helix domain-containing protein [uncultured Amnibacterium sp.]|uniref:helix-turn-helix domain-containing protein n=1 Tax=uncultured Amnibacterium sp. TaxID=1631851 RepID=UPI0035CB57AE